MVLSHSIQAYVVLIIDCKVLQRGGVRIVFQVVLSHCKEYESTWTCKFVYYELGSMYWINLQSSITHRRCTYLKWYPTRESWHMKQALRPRTTLWFGNFVQKIWMNLSKYISRCEEVRREYLVRTYISKLGCANKQTILLRIFKPKKLRQPNIVPHSWNKSVIWSFYAKDTNKSIQEDYQGFISQVYISHIDRGHLKGRTYILKHTSNAWHNENTLYLLIGYMWTTL